MCVSLCLLILTERILAFIGRLLPTNTSRSNFRTVSRQLVEKDADDNIDDLKKACDRFEVYMLLSADVTFSNNHT